MKEIFDTYIADSFGAYEQAPIKFVQFERNYRQYFPADRAARVLDIGVGRGEMLSLMKSWGYADYLGVDISPDTIAYCRTLGLSCELLEDTAAWLLERPGAFSLITLLDVLEHFPKKEIIPFVKALRCSLAPGAIVLVQVPNLQSPDGHIHRYNDFTHEVGFTEDSLRQVLVAGGFRDIAFHGFEELASGGVRGLVARALRGVYWKAVRIARTLNTNKNPAVLNPVFYAACRK